MSTHTTTRVEQLWCHFLFIIQLPWHAFMCLGEPFCFCCFSPSLAAQIQELYWNYDDISKNPQKGRNWQDSWNYKKHVFHFYFIFYCFFLIIFTYGGLTFTSDLGHKHTPQTPNHKHQQVWSAVPGQLRHQERSIRQVQCRRISTKAQNLITGPGAASSTAKRRTRYGGWNTKNLLYMFKFFLILIQDRLSAVAKNGRVLNNPILGEVPHLPYRGGALW